jgi:hypothetical protein
MTLNVSFPLVDQQGIATDIFRKWIIERDPLTGYGSPEGVVTAPLWSLYINRTGTTGTRLYIKVLSDIGGDRAQGWEAV